MNSGKRSGVEVAQLYLTFPESLGEPEKQLRGFHRLPELAPGQITTATFPLTERDLSIYDVDKTGSPWVFPDGKFKVDVGSSSRDIRTSKGFSVCKGKARDNPNAWCP